jgi:hypothetical protein
MTTSHAAMADTTRPQTVQHAGELRHTLRERGWRADLAWVEVGARSAGGAVSAADGADVRRTIAYVPALRALDGGTPRLWKDGDVPVPPVADVREIMLATQGIDEWISEVFEAPPERVESDGLDLDRQAETAGASA